MRYVFLSTEQAAGVYHRESRKGRYQLTYKEAKAVCKFEGGALATYDQLEAARQIGLCRQFWHWSDTTETCRDDCALYLEVQNCARSTLGHFWGLHVQTKTR